MEDAVARSLRQLITSRPVAALGTIHGGAPYVSMVPFVLLEDASAFVVHVSRLAAHTNDMLAEPRVSLLVTEQEHPGVSPRALARLTVLGTAAELPDSAPGHGAARDLYLARFPDAAPAFELGDFSLFAITPGSLRWVGGFAQAATLAPAAFRRAVTGRE